MTVNAANFGLWLPYGQTDEGKTSNSSLKVISVLHYILINTVSRHIVLLFTLFSGKPLNCCKIIVNISWWVRATWLYVVESGMTVLLKCICMGAKVTEKWFHKINWFCQENSSYRMKLLVYISIPA